MLNERYVVVQKLGRRWTKTLLALARENFLAASECLRLTGADENKLREWAAETCQNEAHDGCVTVVYLLGELGFIDLAIEVATNLLNNADEETNEAFVISVSDMYHRMGNHLAAFRFLHDRICFDSSDTFYAKCCDYARDAGLAFVAESLLTQAIADGKTGLLQRLIEHWYEHRNWRNLRNMLSEIKPAPIDPYINYMWGRSCISLLLEEELLQCFDRLWASGDLGHRYANLLSDVWNWRIGVCLVERPADLDADLPWLLAEDYRAMHLARITKDPEGELAQRPASWKILRPRENLPNVLGIGTQRSGTTWLWNHLHERAEVQSLPQKELVFFSDAFRSPADVDPSFRPGGAALADHYWDGPTRNLFRYLAHFQNGCSIRADISPTYAELPAETIKVVAALLGSETRVLLCIRDPIERVWSNLKFDLKIAGVPLSELTFADRCAHYRSETSLRRADSAKVYRDWIRYFEYLKIIVYDEIAVQPDQTLVEVDRYLNLPPIAREQTSERINATEAIDLPPADRAFLLGAYSAFYSDGGFNRWSQRPWRRSQLGSGSSRFFWAVR